MKSMRNSNNSADFETTIRKYLQQGMDKLGNDLAGTREAIRLIAIEKTKDFIRVMDKGLSKEEREYLSTVIVASMYQSFCYGYGIGKVEGSTNNKIFL